MDYLVWIQANVHEARPLTSHWMDCNWLILSSWLILQPAKLVGVSLADVIDKQRRGEGKVRRDSISARLKNLLSSHNSSTSHCGFPNPRAALESRLNWSCLTSARLRIGLLCATQRAPRALMLTSGHHQAALRSDQCIPSLTSTDIKPQKDFYPTTWMLFETFEDLRHKKTFLRYRNIYKEKPWMKKSVSIQLEGLAIFQSQWQDISRLDERGQVVIES